MASVSFTKDELRTIVWAIQNQYAERVRLDLAKGVTPSEDKTIERLLSISRKTYSTLMEVRK